MSQAFMGRVPRVPVPHPRHRVNRWRPACSLAVVLGLVPCASAQLVQQGTFPVPQVPAKVTPGLELHLDKIQGSNVDLLFSSIDGMVANPSATVLYVVNPYGGVVRRFDDLSGNHDTDFIGQVPWGTTSLAYWVDEASGREELLATSRGTYGMTRLDPVTGLVLDFIQLPSEPADIEVLESSNPAVDNHVFVSCSGVDVVVEIDLGTAATDFKASIVHTYDIDASRNLAFMSQRDGLVYVAPMTSGNASMVLGATDTADVLLGLNQVLGVFGDLMGSTFVDRPIEKVALPDADLFVIDPGAQSWAVAASGLGTNLFGHGFNSASPGQEFWILHTDALNVEEQSEPAARGAFLENTITRWNSTITSPSSSTEFGATGLAQPYDLAMTASGDVFVIGLSSDNLVQLDSAGNVKESWQLPAGSIPRDLYVNEAFSFVYVYCWGTNKVHIIEFGSVQHPLCVPPNDCSINLGYDPTSPSRKKGREIFYSAANSEHGDVSCQSCHIEGATDFLVWNLSDIDLETPDRFSFDDKGPMVTQSLKGLEPLGPYHWRGERATLADFNPAFEFLLGAEEELDSPEFDQLQDFLFGLHEPANPRTHLTRTPQDHDSGSMAPVSTEFDWADILADPQLAVLSNFNPAEKNPNGLAVSATAGLDLFMTAQVDGRNTCQDCHMLPTGTVNDFVHDAISDKDRRGVFDTTGFNGLWRKEQKKRESLTFGSPPNDYIVDRPPLGSGTSHAGIRAGVFEFIDEVFNTVMMPEERADVAFFMHQLDSGIAPAVHKAVMVQADSQNPLYWQDAREYVRWLVYLAEAKNCDVVAFGRMTRTSGAVLHRRWFYDTGIDRWVCEDPSVPPVHADYFANQARLNRVSTLVMALPVGMGRRWAIDYDNDQVTNTPDNQQFVPDPNATSPSILSHERIYASARVAKINVVTSERTRIVIDYWETSDPCTVFQARSDALDPCGGDLFHPCNTNLPVVCHMGPVTCHMDTFHTIVLTGLEPSHDPSSGTPVVKTYAGKIYALDEDCNLDMVSMAEFSTMPSIGSIEDAETHGNPTGGVPILETVVKRLDFVEQTVSMQGNPVMKYEGELAHFRTGDPLEDHAVICRIFRRQVPAADPDIWFQDSAFTMVRWNSRGPKLLEEVGYSSQPPFGALAPPNFAPAKFYPGVGRFLVSPVTGQGTTSMAPPLAPGAFELEFELLGSNLACDEIVVVVETVARVNPATWPESVTPDWIAKISGPFLFPATAPEARDSLEDGDPQTIDGCP